MSCRLQHTALALSSRLLHSPFFHYVALSDIFVAMGTRVKRTAELLEGVRAATRFKAAMKTILSVPRSEILKREEEYKRQTALNPRKRGPKPKPKPVVHDPAV